MTATQARTRPLPQRTCVSCGMTTNKRELVRIVRTSEGVVADPTGKLAGRGAYVCGRTDCWQEAIDKGRLAHSLKTTLTQKDAEALRAFAASPGGAD